MALKLFNDSGVAKLQAKDGEESITATADGDVKLYYDNAEKLATTSAGVDVTGDLNFNSGYGSTATAYGCRAWVKFNGSGTVAIYNSANVSSITDLGVGRYRVNFTTAMVDADFAAVSSNANRDGGCYGHSTTDVGVFVGESAIDSTIISVAIFR